MQLHATFHPGSGALKTVLVVGIAMAVLGGAIWYGTETFITNGTLEEKQRGVVMTVSFAPTFVLCILAVMVRRAFVVRRWAVFDIGAGTIRVTRGRRGKVLLSGTITQLVVTQIALIVGGHTSSYSIGGPGVKLELNGRSLSVGTIEGRVQWAEQFPARFESNWLMNTESFVALANQLGLGQQLAAIPARS